MSMSSSEKRLMRWQGGILRTRQHSTAQHTARCVICLFSYCVHGDIQGPWEHSKTAGLQMTTLTVRRAGRLGWDCLLRGEY
jgi:hypothetical protein